MISSNRSTKVAAAVLTTFLSFASIDSADATTVAILDGAPNGGLGHGWYEEIGTQSAGNVFAGTSNNTADLFSFSGFHNYAIFDLASLANQKITGAKLTFLAGNGDYRSNDASETFAVYDYLGNIQDLQTGSLCSSGVATGACAAIYDDLGSGNEYGQATISANFFDPMPLVEITLSEQAVADINSAVAGSLLFAVGGVTTTANPNATEGLWAASGQGAFHLQPAAQLDLELAPIPLPAALPLLLSALAGMGLLGWRRKRAVAA